MNRLINDIPGVKQFKDMVEFLTAGETWVRLGEILVGAILLKVGLQAALGGSLKNSAPNPKPAIGKVATAVNPSKAFKAPSHHTSMGGLGSRSGSTHINRS